MHTIRSISQVGTSEPFELQVSRGQIPGHYRIHKFGFNVDIDDVEETIWDAGGVYSYPSSAVKMTATSAGGADDEFVQVTIQGLDANYNELSETVTLGGTGAAETNGLFLRVYRAFVAGSQAPTDTITITNSSTTYAQIGDGENQTLMALWTVPAGYTAYLMQKDITCLTETSAKFGTIRLLSREVGGVFRVHEKVTVRNNHIEITYTTPLVFPEKTDIEVRGVASGSAANLSISAALDIIYIKNEGAL